MASSSSSSSSTLSARFGSSVSPSSSSSSLSSLYSKGPRARTLPRRGQIKAAIFASFFASIARFLGAKTSKNGGNSQDGVGSHTHMSDLRMDVEGALSTDEGGGFELSVRSSPVSNWSGSETPNSPFKRISCPHSFHDHEGMHVEG